MKIVIWSTISGKASGNLTLNVNSNDKIRTLVELYCQHKNLNPDEYALSKNLNVLDPNKSIKEENINDGAKLALINSGSKGGLFSFSNWWFLAIVAVLIGVLGVLFAIYLFILPPTIPKKYGVVIDAGSSHSELYLFTWDSYKPLGTADDMDLMHRCFTAGGIDSFRNHPADLDKYLSPCLKEAVDKIPAMSQSHTHIFVAATAGMRILRDFDPVAATGILTRIREILLRRTKFVVLERNVFILPGKVEGISGWTATNYLLGSLLENVITSAVLDLGGASMQVSREFQKPTKWKTTNVTLFNTVRSVYSHTFMCYGLTEARHRHNFLLVNNYSDVTLVKTLQEPCLAVGQQLDLHLHDYEVPCTIDSNPSLSLPSQSNLRFIQKYKTAKPTVDDYERNIEEKLLAYISENNTFSTDNLLSNSNIILAKTDRDAFSNDNLETILYKVVGTSDAKECLKRTKILFNETICSSTFKYGNCLQQNGVPKFRKELVAFSDIFSLLLPLFGVNENSTLDDFHNGLMEICSLNITERKKRIPDISALLFEDLCFDGTYVYNLLTDGLGINQESWRGIDFTNKIQENNVEWVLGFIVNKTSTWPSEDPVPVLDTTPFILIVALFTCFILCGILIIYHAVMMKKQSNKYQRLIDGNFFEKIKPDC